jgi:hypothetical protein
MVPLFLGEKDNRSPNGVTLGSVRSKVTHRWVAFVVLIETLLHVIGKLVVRETTILHDRREIIGLVVRIQFCASNPN